MREREKERYIKRDRETERERDRKRQRDCQLTFLLLIVACTIVPLKHGSRYSGVSENCQMNKEILFRLFLDNARVLISVKIFSGCIFHAGLCESMNLILSIPQKCHEDHHRR